MPKSASDLRQQLIDDHESYFDQDQPELRRTGKPACQPDYHVFVFDSHDDPVTARPRCLCGAELF